MHPAYKGFYRVEACLAQQAKSFEKANWSRIHLPPIRFLSDCNWAGYFSMERMHNQETNPRTARESTTDSCKVTRGADEGSKPKTAVLPLEHYSYIAYTFT